MSSASSKPNALRRLLGDSSGASALEFSLVLMPFLLLLVGSMELGRYYFTAENIRSLVAETGRQAVLNKNFGGNGSCASLSDANKQIIAKKTPFVNWHDLTICVQNGVGPGTVNITVQASYPFSTPFPFISQLNSNTAFRQTSALTLKRY